MTCRQANIVTIMSELDALVEKTDQMHSTKIFHANSSMDFLRSANFSCLCFESSIFVTKNSRSIFKIIGNVANKIKLITFYGFDLLRINFNVLI